MLDSLWYSEMSVPRKRLNANRRKLTCICLSLPKLKYLLETKY